MLLPGRNAVFGGGGVTSGFADASFALVLASCVMLLALVVMTSSTPSGTSVLLGRARTVTLWDLAEGGPTAEDGFGQDYNPVVLDDAVARRGYPASNGGWREFHCGDSTNGLTNEYPCVNTPNPYKRLDPEYVGDFNPQSEAYNDMSAEYNGNENNWNYGYYGGLFKE